MASTGSLRNVNESNKKYGLIIPNKSEKKKVNLSFGLNRMKPTTKFGLNNKLPKKNTIFSQMNENDESEDEDTNERKNISELMQAKNNINRELRSFTKQSNKQEEAEYRKAIEEDPNIFDYDAVYDDMKKEEIYRKKGKTDKEKELKKKPKYIESLLEAAERRKKEYTRIMERKIQREREEEGDKFKDKEMFVTSGYKEQQEELRRLEEEEKKKEAEENNNVGNMTGFYRQILNERAHDYEPRKLTKTEDKNKKYNKEEYEEEEVEEKEDIVKEAIKSGKKVQLNDNEEVIDKRQLLSAGLNISKKKKEDLVREKEELEKRKREEKRREYEKRKEEERQKREEERRRREAIREQKRRAYDYVQEQMKEKEKEKIIEKHHHHEEIVKKMAKRATAETISDAKRRYLERKKARENANNQ